MFGKYWRKILFWVECWAIFVPKQSTFIFLWNKYMCIKVKWTSKNLMIAMICQNFYGPCIYKIKEIHSLHWEHPIATNCLHSNWVIHVHISTESYIPLSFLVSVFYSRNIENFIPISSRQRETRESLGRLNEWNNVYSRLHNSSPHSLSCSSKLSLLFLSLERPQKINSSVSYMQSVYTCIGPCPPRLLYTH